MRPSVRSSALLLVAALALTACESGGAADKVAAAPGGASPSASASASAAARPASKLSGYAAEMEAGVRDTAPGTILYDHLFTELGDSIGDTGFTVLVGKEVVHEEGDDGVDQEFVVDAAGNRMELSQTSIHYQDLDLAVWGDVLTGSGETAVNGLVASGSKIARLDPYDGTEVWSIADGDAGSTSYYVTDEAVARVGSSVTEPAGEDKTHTITFFSTEDGSELSWNVLQPGEAVYGGGRHWLRIVAAPGFPETGEDTGEVIDTRSGRRVPAPSMDTATPELPAAAEGGAITYTVDGQQLWSVAGAGTVLDARHGRVAVMGEDSGDLVVLDAADGSVVSTVKVVADPQLGPDCDYDKGGVLLSAEAVALECRHSRVVVLAV